MQSNIHPKWYNNAKVTCTCGNTFETGSTEPTITVDICSKCHPYFTGEMKFVDRQGRVDKFKKKMEKAEKVRAQKARELEEKLAQKTQQDDIEEQSYQDILRQKQAQLRNSSAASAKSGLTAQKSKSSSKTKSDDTDAKTKDSK